MNYRLAIKDISGNSFFSNGNDNGFLRNIGWIGKFGDLVNRIVGSNSKIGNFTNLKFLFSHIGAKN